MSGLFQTQVQGFDELRRALESLPNKLGRTEARKAVLAGAAVIRERARRNAPRDTGDLARNIVAWYQRSSSGEFTYRVGIKKKGWYGLFTEIGTGPHTIVPHGRSKDQTISYQRRSRRTGQMTTVSRTMRARSGKRALRFFVAGGRGGQKGDAFAAIVRHPGQAARPFLRPALADNRAEIIDAVRARLAKALTKRGLL